MNRIIPAAEHRISYGQAIRRFSKNARLYLIYSTMSGINSAIFLVAFAFYLEEIFTSGASLFGLSFEPITFIALALGAQALAHGLNSVPSGFIGDKFGRKRSFILASLVAVLAGALVLVTFDPLMLVLLAVVAGIGEAFHGVVGAPFLMENSQEEERMHLFSLSAVLGSLSTVVGAFLGAVLPSLFLIFVTAQGVDMLGALGFGGERAAALRLTLMMSVPFGIVELLPLTRMKESFVQSPTPLREIFLLKHVKNRITLGKLFLVSLLYAAGLGVYFPLLNLHFEASFHIHEAEFGSITAFNNIAILASMLAVPLVVLRLGKIRTIVASRFLAAPFLVALSFSPTLFLASLFFVMRGALATMAMPIASAYSMEVVNESERATTAGFTHMAFDLAYGALIFAGGLLFALGGFWAAFVVGGVLYLSHATLWWVFFRNHRVEKRTVF